MDTTRLSSKGQVIIPKHIRETHHWDPGMELQVIEFEGGVLLKPTVSFSLSSIDDVAGCLAYSCAVKADQDIENALKIAARKAWRDSN